MHVHHCDHSAAAAIFSNGTYFLDTLRKMKSVRYHKFTYIFIWSSHYSCQNLIKIEFSRQIFKKSSYWFHENPSRGSQVVIRRCTNMTKLIVAFHNFVNTSKNAKDNSVLLWLPNIIAKCRLPITFYHLIFSPKQSSKKTYKQNWPQFFQALTPFRSDFFGGKDLRFWYYSCSGFCLAKGKVYYLLNITFTVCSIMHITNSSK
jgi:hypothetical protein